MIRNHKICLFHLTLNNGYLNKNLIEYLDSTHRVNFIVGSWGPGNYLVPKYDLSHKSIQLEISDHHSICNSLLSSHKKFQPDRPKNWLCYSQKTYAHIWNDWYFECHFGPKLGQTLFDKYHSMKHFNLKYNKTWIWGPKNL